MSELVLFTLNAIVIYLLSDWILRVIEKRRGAVIKQRQIVFFVIFHITGNIPCIVRLHPEGYICNIQIVVCCVFFILA